MTYRSTPASTERRARKIEAMRRGKEAARLAREPEGRMPDLPTVRRVIVIIDYDTGVPIERRIELRRTTRVDSYLVVTDGQPARRGSWSRVCAGIRKAYPRVPSPRSDAWR